MGLDMYLTKRTWVGLNYEHNRETGYWRKANHIHQWFVENIQDGNDDCREYYVPRERLKELLEILS